MEADLATALARHYGEHRTPINEQHFQFAMTNRTRGAKVLDQVAKHARFDYAGKRTLDVGAAYGGFTIGAAARGADAWGVEISRRLWELGNLNAQGEAGKIHLLHGDFLAREVLAALPRDFDLVLVNDVFEHIYDTASLLARLHAVMKPGAPFMFAIPNGDCVKFVAREGHSGVPGLPLVAPNVWHQVVPSYTAYYRPWSYYAGLFRAFGFTRIEPWNAQPLKALTLADARTRIKDELAQAKAAVHGLTYLDERGREPMLAGWSEYEGRVRADLVDADLATLNWRYLVTFWRGCAYKEGPVLADLGVPALPAKPKKAPAAKPVAKAKTLGARLRAVARKVTSKARAKARR